MKSLWIGILVGATVYGFIVHWPTWILISNVIGDTMLILDYLKETPKNVSKRY